MADRVIFKTVFLHKFTAISTIFCFDTKRTTCNDINKVVFISV